MKLRTKILHKSVRTSLSFLPLLVSVIAVENKSAILGIMSVILMFAVVALLPFTRGHESIWIFLLSTVVSIPLNVKLVVVIMRFIGEYIDSVALNVMLYGFFYMAIYCVEEIILGYFSTLLWKKQKVIS